MMRACPAIVLMTMMVSCFDGFEESQSDAIVSAGGAVSEKNRWRLDAGDNRSMNRCIIAWSSARVERKDAVVPSRMMTVPDSRLPEAGSGWNNGRICFMSSHAFIGRDVAYLIRFVPCLQHPSRASVTDDPRLPVGARSSSHDPSE